MKTINELLHRLAELEPDVFWISEAYGESRFQWKHCPGEFYYERENEFYEPEGWGQLQWAVQQAVESRGWDIALSSEDEDHVETGVKVYTGEIKAPSSSGLQWYASDPDKSPAHALLAAYIKALEAVAEVAE